MAEAQLHETGPAHQVGAALGAAAARLRQSGSPSPRLDAELLLAHAVGRDRAWVLSHPDEPLGADDAAGLEAAVARRATGEPVAYIRGFKEWFSLRVAVDARALIPRPETELLAEEAIREVAARLARRDAPIVAWDVATGTGAVILAMALRFRTAVALGRVRLIASDLFTDAVELAAKNLETHGVVGEVTLARADLLAEAGGTLPRPDVVVANLPYLTSDEVARGAGSIAHEPPRALDGGRDGLDLVRRLLDNLPGRVAPGATVLLEIGSGQAEEVLSLAPADTSAVSLPDLAGIARVVRFELP